MAVARGFDRLRGVSPLLFYRHLAERPNPRPGYLWVRTCTGEDSPFHPFSSVGARAAPTRPVRSAGWRNAPSAGQLPLACARGSHASSVGTRGPVSVPAPAVSRPGLAPGHLPGRWGDFSHVPCGRAHGDRTAMPSCPRLHVPFCRGQNAVRDTGAGLPLPPRVTGSAVVSRSVVTPAVAGVVPGPPRDPHLCWTGVC